MEQETEKTPHTTACGNEWGERNSVGGMDVQCIFHCVDMSLGQRTQLHSIFPNYPLTMEVQ